MMQEYILSDMMMRYKCRQRVSVTGADYSDIRRRKGSVFTVCLFSTTFGNIIFFLSVSDDNFLPGFLRGQIYASFKKEFL